MAGVNTGELYTQDQVDAMTEDERARVGLMPVTPAESEKLSGMTIEERKKFLKRKAKKPSRKQLNKRERVNRKAGRK